MLPLSGLGAGAAGLDLLKGSPTPGELFLDGFDSGGPYEGFGILIPSFKKCLNGSLQIGYAAEDAAADSFIVQVTEPSFNQIHPTGTGRDKVRHEARMPFQPRLDFGVLVRPVVIHNQM